MICDGGSTDGTADLVEAYARRHPHALPNLRLIVAPGANISRGRNLAIAAAAGPLIAATDAGVRLEPTWLADLVAPWEEAAAKGHEAPIAAAGFFVPDAEGVFQTAMAATVLPLLDEIDPHRFLPSSRSVAFTKDAWARAGGYPEWLDYCEDLLFDFAVNAQRPERPTAFAWAPAAVVHFRPRTSLGAFWRQYYHYARGDGKADLWRKRHAIRYATYLVDPARPPGPRLLRLLRPLARLAGAAGRHHPLLPPALAAARNPRPRPLGRPAAGGRGPGARHPRGRRCRPRWWATRSASGGGS